MTIPACHNPPPLPRRGGHLSRSRKITMRQIARKSGRGGGAGKEERGDARNARNANRHRHQCCRREGSTPCRLKEAIAAVPRSFSSSSPPPPPTPPSRTVHGTGARERISARRTKIGRLGRPGVLLTRGARGYRGRSPPPLPSAGRRTPRTRAALVGVQRKHMCRGRAVFSTAADLLPVAVPSRRLRREVPGARTAGARGARPRGRRSPGR